MRVSGRWLRVGAPPWRARSRGPRQEAGGHHREHEQQPDDDVDDVDRDALEAQRAGEHADQEDTGEDAVQAAAAAEDRDAAEEHGRDDLQLEPGRVVAAGAAEPECVVDAGEGGDHSAQRRTAMNLVRSTSTPVKCAASVFSPIVVDAAAERGEVQQQRERRSASTTNGTMISGMLVLADLRLGEVGPPLGEVGDRLGAEQADGEPAEEGQRADGDRERRAARRRRRGSR